MNRVISFIIITFFILGAGCFGFAPAMADQRADVLRTRDYVIVTLKDKTIRRFDQDSFQFPWVTFEIKEEFTCKVTPFAIAEVDEIYVQTVGLNDCDQRKDWLFDIRFRNGDAADGFMEVQEEAVRATDRKSGAEVVIPFVEIEKISFFHLEK